MANECACKGCGSVLHGRSKQCPKYMRAKGTARDMQRCTACFCTACNQPRDSGCTCTISLNCLGCMQPRFNANGEAAIQNLCRSCWKSRGRPVIDRALECSQCKGYMKKQGTARDANLCQKCFDKKHPGGNIHLAAQAATRDPAHTHA